jgi:hypothetical protein
MKKAKSKKEAAPKKTAEKSSGSGKDKKPATLAEARQGITDLVRSESKGMAKAVLAEGKKGQLAPVKYLFEVSGLYPAAEGTEAKPEQNSLANFLLNKLGIPVVPVVVDEDEVWVNMAPVKSKADADGETQVEKAADDSASSNSAGVEENGDDPVTPETIP